MALALRFVHGAVRARGGTVGSTAFRSAPASFFLPHATALPTGARPLSSIAAELNTLSSALPYMEVVHFPAKQYKWTTLDLKKYTDAFASGLAEAGFKTGDALAMWIPKDTAEALVIKFTCARLGLLLVEIDGAVAEPEKLKAILNEHKAKGLVYDPEMGDRYNTDLLKRVMPELEVYDSAFGKGFRSREVPSMKLLMHTHIDIIEGAQNLKYMMTYNPPASMLPAVPPNSTPLSVVYGPGSGDKAQVLTQAQALASPAWADVKKVLAKEHAIYNEKCS